MRDDRGERVMNILSIENINKSYKNKAVLKDISFSINEGEIVALIGPNGAGKTTLMKIISNLLDQDSGTVKICGLLAKDNRVDYLSKFSSIIETPSLYEMLSGYENINFIRKINNISMEKMNSILKFINIGKSINDKVKNYSLGMKQRLALGIALINEPKLLILDEPTNGLDPEGVIEFRGLLKKFASESGMSILISSHILSELDKICTRVLFIKDGELVEIEDINKNNDIQIVILVVENPEEIIKLIQEIDLVDKVNIIDNKLIIQVDKNKTSKLISILIEKNIEYSNIEIQNTNIEKIYRDVYLGGKNE